MRSPRSTHRLCTLEIERACRTAKGSATSSDSEKRTLALPDMVAVRVLSSVGVSVLHGASEM